MSQHRSILVAAFVSEAVLALLAFGIFKITSLSVSLQASPSDVALGAASAIPLLILNHVLWRMSAKRPDGVFARFSREVVVPVCRSIAPLSAAVVALLSGFAEELLFRGAISLVLQEAAGMAVAAVVSSVLFAYVHFIGNLKRFGGMLPLYTFVGLYLWGVAQLTGSLAAAMVAHAAYNFLAILLIRALAR